MVAFGGPSWVVLIAAFLGMLNGMGKDRGAIPVLESAMLPATTDDRERTVVFARYTALQDVGHGIGALVTGLPTLFMFLPGVALSDATAWSLGVYAGLALLVMPFYLALSPAVEVSAHAKVQPVTPEGKRTIAKLSALFSLDALGGGFITSAGMTYIFATHFNASAITIALLFVAARILNALSQGLPRTSCNDLS